MDDMSRRRFIEMMGLAGVATALPLNLHAQTGKALGELKEGYSFFNVSEASFVETAVSRLIPKDELGPGALESGVSYFIDQQLAGSFGTGAKMFRQGPWAEGAPEQGYQLPLTPQQVYRIGIAETNSYCAGKYSKPFSSLSAVEQEEVLKGLDNGSIHMDALPEKIFFGMLYQNTIEGFFADPIYGGNRNKAGWKLVGYPGVSADYGSSIEEYNKPYRVEPVSIADVLQGEAKLDKHGHPMHKHIKE